MQSFHHSRARILFEVACAFGISASCVWAWQQTWSTAMLPVAAIAALYGLVHAFDMVRGSSKAAESVAAAEPATDQGDFLAYAESPEVDPVPEFAESPVAEVAEPSAKRSRRSPKTRAARGKPESEAVELTAEPQPEIAAVAVQPAPEPVGVADEPEIAELPPELRIVESAPDEPQYVPATPLFEAEPFVRQQRAAFGRKAR
jgi:hypothetical protein